MSSRRSFWLQALLPAGLILGVVFWANDVRPSRAALPDDPEALIDLALERCARINDYTCTFGRHERVAGKLGKPQKMAINFREDPFSIHMRWLENAGRIRRALYVAGQHQKPDGTEVVLVEPSGAIARALKPKVEIPLRGAEAQKASRYTLDEFGFKAALERIRDQNERFGSFVRWDPLRTGRVDGRPTIILTRHLPRHENPQRYPDAKLVIELDREWLLPVNLQAFADAAGQTLIEHYWCRDLRLNPGLSDADFTF